MSLFGWLDDKLAPTTEWGTPIRIVRLANPDHRHVLRYIRIRAVSESTFDPLLPFTYQPTRWHMSIDAFETHRSGPTRYELMSMGDLDELIAHVYYHVTVRCLQRRLDWLRNTSERTVRLSEAVSG